MQLPSNLILISGMIYDLNEIVGVSVAIEANSLSVQFGLTESPQALMQFKGGDTASVDCTPDELEQLKAAWFKHHTPRKQVGVLSDTVYRFDQVAHVSHSPTRGQITLRQVGTHTSDTWEIPADEAWVFYNGWLAYHGGL